MSFFTSICVSLSFFRFCWLIRVSIVIELAGPEIFANMPMASSLSSSHRWKFVYTECCHDVILDFRLRTFNDTTHFLFFYSFKTRKWGMFDPVVNFLKLNAHTKRARFLRVPPWSGLMGGTQGGVPSCRGTPRPGLMGRYPRWVSHPPGPGQVPLQLDLAGVPPPHGVDRQMDGLMVRYV